MESFLDNLRFLGPEPASLSTPAGTHPLLIQPFLPLPAPERGTGVRPQGYVQRSPGQSHWLMHPL